MAQRRKLRASTPPGHGPTLSHRPHRGPTCSKCGAELAFSGTFGFYCLRCG